MIQFSESERKGFLESEGAAGFAAGLRHGLEDYLAHPLMVPKGGVSNWSHYFYCPRCSVRLIHDLDKPFSHECPVCHEIYSDEEKNGAWWMLTNERNASAAYDLGLLYMLEGDKKDLGRCFSILSAYAEQYPDYPVHGDIPYNGPGKLDAQTLDEANFLRTMAYAYDLISDDLEESDKTLVCSRLFRPGALFLLEHRTRQIHNHEVIINGALGVLALLLGDEGLLERALKDEYGFLYQLDNGLLEDGFWFECSTAYHLYALESFLHYEKFARHTRYSNLSRPGYMRMINAFLSLRQDDGAYPLLGDAHPGQNIAENHDMFEFLCSVYRTDGLYRIVSNMRKRSGKTGRETFLYGLKDIPCDVPEVSLSSSFPQTGLGASIIRRKPHWLLLRHGPYGGEHDHYDRLGISYSYDGVPISMDLGTTGYGAKLHYAYYKKTLSHSTVAINEENQAPSEGRLLWFKEDGLSTVVKARVDWKPGYRMPDSFVIRQWDEKSYDGVSMERTICVCDHAVIDLMKVSGACCGTMDYALHLHGRRTDGIRGKEIHGFSDKEPLCLLEDVQLVEGGKIHLSFGNSGVFTDLFIAGGDVSVYTARAFDNPSSNTMCKIVERCCGAGHVFMNVLSPYRGDKVVDDVSFSLQEGCAEISLLSEKRCIYSVRLPL